MPCVGDAVDHDELISAVVRATDEVEGLLRERMERVSCSADQSKRRGQYSDQDAIARACLQAEGLRRRQMEELVTGWQSLVWGPDVDALVRDADRLAVARKMQARAAKDAEHAWRETVQLAAEGLSDDGPIGEASEDLSRAAKRYKEIGCQLHANLDRLTSLEKSCGSIEQ